MWSPDSSHEKRPHYWLVAGLVLIVMGTYLAIALDRSYLYLGVGVGVACCIWSIRIFTQHKSRLPEPFHDPDLDQTCELNYDPRKN